MPEVVRRVRELLVVSTTLGIAAAAHLFAGGTLPGSVGGWVVTVALMLPVVVWTARRPLTLPRLLPSMTLLQVVAHTALSVMTASTAPAAASSTAGASTAGLHAGHLVLAPGSLAPPSADAAHLHQAGDPRAGVLMLAAHAVAVVATALLLTAGDRAAAWVLVWLGAVALLVEGPPAGLVRDHRPGLAARGSGWVPRSWVGRSGLRLRGPPRVAAPA